LETKDSFSFNSVDSRVKIVASLFISLLLSLTRGFLAKSLVFLFILFVSFACKIDFKKIRFILVFLTFSSAMNLIYITGGNVLIKIGKFAITATALKYTFLMIINTVTLALIALVLTKITNKSDFSRTPPRLAKFLLLFGIDAGEISMIIILVLRFIPVVFEETEKVIFAQKSRAAPINSGNIIKRIRAFTPVMVCVFASCFQKAVNTALAMEARHYGAFPEKTSLKETKIEKYDIAIIISIAFLAVGVFLLDRFFEI
jgi:energy-coupling factor transport system permease protein